MESCDQDTIIGATFSCLKGASLLGMNSCSYAVIAAAQSLGLPVLTGEGTWGALTYEPADR
jgi:PIN domain nuclease of toxin-antitoxin system